MSTFQPITLVGDAGINPFKVAIVLEELQIPYQGQTVLLADIKKPAYESINPNGRLPSIQDPNTDITLWESGAIIEYLIEKYDTQHKLSFERGTEEYYHAKQWLHFQMSGQGPYYGQAFWFKNFHKEQLPTALARYVGEMHRVSDVVNRFLGGKKQGDGEVWLVGDKCSYADLAFIPWQKSVGMAFSEEEYSLEKYPHMKAWLESMLAREAVQTAMGKVFKKMP